MFEKIKELFSKHPYLIGGGALVVFVIFYYLFSRGSSGTTTLSSSGSTTDAQTAALDAQQNIAQLQAQTQLAALNIQAGVQSQGISAQQDVTNNQTAAELQALQSNNTTQMQLAQVQAGQNEAQVKALEDIVTAQYTSQEQAAADVYGYLTAVNTNATDVQKTAITAQQNLDLASLSHVKDVNGSQNRTAIILGATGNIPGSVTAEQGQTASSISGDSLLGTIAGGAAKAFSALF